MTVGALAAALAAALPAQAPAQQAAAPVAALPADNKTAAADQPDTRTPLERLWTEPDGVGFLPYRQSYVMFTQTSTPNDAPQSGNPVNNVPYSYGLQHTEIKFAFSMKAMVVSSSILQRHNSIWFAYSQQSHWQALDAAHSRPFIESDYQPELVFSHRFGDALEERRGLQPLFFNLTLAHQSNGQSDPRSRGWNRITGQLGVVERLGDDHSLALMIRPWYRIHEPVSSDNNPDIGHYLGHGDIEVIYWNGSNMLSLLARTRSAQLDFSTPLLFLNEGKPKKNSLQFHVQLFAGYGESLTDYSQRHTTFGLGVSVPYGL
jgi:phospholipase A1